MIYRNCRPTSNSRYSQLTPRSIIGSGGLTYKHYKARAWGPCFPGASILCWRFILYLHFIEIHSQYVRNHKARAVRSDSSYIPAGPCAARTSRRAARPSDGAQKRKQAELKKKKTDALPKMTSFFPTNQLESGKDNNVCQESQSLSSVRIQIEKNSTTGTSDDNFDDDEINSEIKTPVPVPDKSEPVIVAIPEVSKIELVNSNKKTCWAVDGIF
ncbi:hypothetical protein EVAR_51372_1 [Eumeta japonica]|uniref:Uncharacterized protein n=1 Tax=Eumeta variegata TaxID=151549 RepID=A0A4C1Y212_EUMVA|nr:hypothetical protein EVAR_51372_1 [Eumeta japonica]